MRFRRSSLALSFLLVAAVAVHGPASAAESAAKPAEFVTIGVATKPLPATPGMLVNRLTPLQSATPAGAPNVPTIEWKQASSPTLAPASHIALSAEQRAKQAAIPAPEPQVASVAEKPAPLATILPAPPGAQAADRAAKPPLVMTPVSGASTRGVSAALGVIPRESWRELAASKPQPISTIERVTSATPAPASPINVQKGRIPATAVKATEVTTTAPRDPAAPLEGPNKGLEVRP